MALYPTDRPSETTRIHGRSTAAFDKEDYKGRNVVEPNFNTFKQWRALATRYDNSPSPTAAAQSSEQSASG